MNVALNVRTLSYCSSRAASCKDPYMCIKCYADVVPNKHSLGIRKFIHVTASNKCKLEKDDYRLHVKVLFVENLAKWSLYDACICGEVTGINPGLQRNCFKAVIGYTATDPDITVTYVDDEYPLYANDGHPFMKIDIAPAKSKDVEEIEAEVILRAVNNNDYQIYTRYRSSNKCRACRNKLAAVAEAARVEEENRIACRFPPPAPQ